MAIERRETRTVAIGQWLQVLESATGGRPTWISERAALALAGGGVRDAESALRRYGGIRSTDGSWRGTRWIELTRVLSMPFPERISEIWSLFPFEAHALVLAEPSPDELHTIVTLLLGQVAREPRDIPSGAACLLACAVMAKERGLALPPWQSDWWLVEHAWGNASAPSIEFEGRPLHPICPPQMHPATARDPLTVTWTRIVLRNDPFNLADSTYRDIGPGWMLLADLDEFKKINDYYGMRSGDVVLAHLADRLQRRLGDCVVRYSGEQFIVFWRGEGGLEVAEEMRALVERKPFPLSETDESIDVTISIGATRFDDVGEGIENALQALWDAKRAGRNCVRTWGLP